MAHSLNNFTEPNVIKLKDVIYECSKRARVVVYDKPFQLSLMLTS
jgi:hypothetical protein